MAVVELRPPQPSLYGVLSIIDAIQQLLCAEIKIFDTFRLLTIIPRVFLFE